MFSLSARTVEGQHEIFFRKFILIVNLAAYEACCSCLLLSFCCSVPCLLVDRKDASAACGFVLLGYYCEGV